MRLKEDIKPITYMKTQAAELVRQVTETGRPVVITQSGEAQVVVLDIAAYETLRNAATLLRLTSHGEADIAAGRVVAQAAVFARVRKRPAK